MCDAELGAVCGLNRMLGSGGVRECLSLRSGGRARRMGGGLLKDEGLPRFACADVSKDRSSCGWCETQCNFVYSSGLLIFLRRGTHTNLFLLCLYFFPFHSTGSHRNEGEGEDAAFGVEKRTAVYWKPAHHTHTDPLVSAIAIALAASESQQTPHNQGFPRSWIPVYPDLGR